MKTFMVLVVSMFAGCTVLGTAFMVEKETNMTPAQRAAEAYARSPEGTYQALLERRAAAIRLERQEKNDLDRLMFQQDLQRRARP